MSRGRRIGTRLICSLRVSFRELILISLSEQIKRNNERVFFQRELLGVFSDRTSFVDQFCYFLSKSSCAYSTLTSTKITIPKKEMRSGNFYFGEIYAGVNDLEICRACLDGWNSRDTVRGKIPNARDASAKESRRGKFSKLVFHSRRQLIRIISNSVNELRNRDGFFGFLSLARSLACAKTWK